MSDSKTVARYAPARPKVTPFARYKGTSAWKKYPKRVRAYAHFKAAIANQQLKSA